MLVFLELGKLLRMPVVVGFTALCLVFNAALVFGNLSLDATLNGPADDAPPARPENVFAGLRASDIAEGYIAYYRIDEGDAERLRAKYERLQPIIDEKARRGDALSEYFGAHATHGNHGLLFGLLLPAILLESGILALFAALLLTGYESVRGTEGSVYASRVGRGILMRKLAASQLVGLGFFVLIAVAALGLFFACSDWSEVWSSNVSSAWNFAVREYGKAFITWQSMTVAQYLGASLVLCVALVACFGLLGFAVGTLVRNGYATAVLALALCFMPLLICALLPVASLPRAVLGLAPAGLWAAGGEWFTDGGADILWAHFECWGTALNLVILAAAAVMARFVFNRKELA